MPVTHVKDIPATEYRTWLNLTDDEKNTIANAINNHPGTHIAEAEEIKLTKIVGKQTPSGEVIHFAIYNSEKELPDSLLNTLDETLVSEGIANHIQNISVMRDPAGEAFHKANNGDILPRLKARASHPV